MYRLALQEFCMSIIIDQPCFITQITKAGIGHFFNPRALFVYGTVLPTGDSPASPTFNSPPPLLMFLHAYCTLGTSDFDAQMSDIKI
jgi:hypothetical protein